MGKSDDVTRYELRVTRRRLIATSAAAGAALIAPRTLSSPAVAQTLP